jgi:protein arginine kinase activator
MLCNVCAKNQATVHLTEIVDDQMTELHLCEECAHKKSAQMESQFGLGDLLAGLSEFEKPAGKKENALMKCPACGLTYNDFRKIGRLGCAECYTAFKKYLGPLLKRIHGSSQHTGKGPFQPVKAARKKTDLQDLRKQLQKAVESEAFEEAARLRDQIKEAERKQSGDPKEEKNGTK